MSSWHVVQCECMQCREMKERKTGINTVRKRVGWWLGV